MQKRAVLNIISRVVTLSILTLLLLCSGPVVFAQKTSHHQDSLAKARQQQLDEVRTARKKTMDSSRVARQEILDSIKAVRKDFADSLASVRKYRESRHFKDSLTHARQQRIDFMHDVQKSHFDSIKTARQRSTDSLIASRKASTDALRTGQKRRTDSLAAIRKYKDSRRFQDSVAIVRKIRMDSVHASRKDYNDSVLTARKKAVDDMKRARKVTSDSIAAIRKGHMDSVLAARKEKADVMARNKANKERLTKATQKQRESLANLKLELKIKKKREAWNNEKMLKKKWSVPRQVVQNTFTRYNYYFNANRKMEEALANMQRIGKDNYESQLPLFPFDPDKDSTAIAPDMDSVIQKASLGIQIHDPRTKWGDDLYLLLGQAYFYKGDYNNATSSFRYIVAMRERMKADEAKRHAYSNRSVKGKKELPSIVEPDDKKLLDFLKHQPANNDALLWLARTYTQAGKESEAESVLDLLGSDSKFPESLRGRLALEKAFLDLRQRNSRDAAVQLALVSADKGQPEWIRRRAAYLDGQLLQQQGSYEASAAQFAKVIDMQPKIEMDFYARRNRAYNLMLAGGNQDEAIASLRSMLNDGKYTQYYEQIYYVLGRLAVNSGKNKEAEEYLLKGIASTRTTKKQKASSFAAIGNIYYYSGNYEGAKRAYDSASALASYAAEDSAVILAVRRSQVLDKVAIPTRIIHNQDSLLLLAGLSPKEQRAAARRYIRSLEQRQADSAFNAEHAGINSAIQQEAAPGDATASSWYFSNPAVMQQGYTEFKRKWGTRPLVDNWRRTGAIGLASNTGNNTGEPDPLANGIAGQDGMAVQLDERGIPTEESLLAFIPTSQAQQDESRRMIQRAYVDLGNGYIKQLDDYQHATIALDTLDRRFATQPYGAEESYIRYLIALRRNDLPGAQKYSNQLQQQYAGTQWAAMVRPTEDGSNLNAPGTTGVADYYDQTYSLLMQRQYGEVLSRSRNGRRQYQDETYGNRFRMMEVIALAGSGNYVEADTLLGDFMRTHPGDPLQGWAENVANYIREQRKADSGKTIIPPPAPTATASNTGSIPPPNTNKGISVAPMDSSSLVQPPSTYSYKPQETHYFVFSFFKIESRAMGVKSGLNDFNNMHFGGMGLSAELVPLGRGEEGMILVKSFKNAALAKGYLTQFKAANVLVREYNPNEYHVFIISAQNYVKLVSDRIIQPYLAYYTAHY